MCSELQHFHSQSIYPKSYTSIFPEKTSSMDKLFGNMNISNKCISEKGFQLEASTMESDSGFNSSTSDSGSSLYSEIDNSIYNVLQMFDDANLTGPVYAIVSMLNRMTTSYEKLKIYFYNTLTAQSNEDLNYIAKKAGILLDFTVSRESEIRKKIRLIYNLFYSRDIFERNPNINIDKMSENFKEVMKETKKYVQSETEKYQFEFSFTYESLTEGQKEDIAKVFINELDIPWYDLTEQEIYDLCFPFITKDAFNFNIDESPSDSRRFTLDTTTYIDQFIPPWKGMMKTLDENTNITFVYGNFAEYETVATLVERGVFYEVHMPTWVLMEEYNDIYTDLCEYIYKIYDSPFR